ncbi:MAG: endolytic transglycosylase MltG [Capsulimonadales bacterium]|nr:endolytic transglycosylase MltG [Capsulimonadales bacterium]
MYKRLRWFIVFLLLLTLVAAYLGGTAYWRWLLAPAEPTVTRRQRIVIPPGATVTAVGQQLEREGVIRSGRAFAFLGKDRTIKPGTYDLSPSETPVGLLRRLEKGDVATNRVTFPEGFTLRQIAARLARQGLIADPETFLNLTTTRGGTFKASFRPPANLEGYLFPDTYLFPVGDDDRRIAQRMLDNFDRLFSRGKADDIRDSGRTLSELVNVAAMVEREAETEPDRATIAGVIYNRLARKMRLEIDATVQYARGQHKNRLLFRDLEIDSPYNTYRVTGLPAGPICCPGLPSLEAALHPEKHDYLFYVARPDGSHAFSRTFAEHQRNIAEIRRK